MNTAPAPEPQNEPDPELAEAPARALWLGAWRYELAKIAVLALIGALVGGLLHQAALGVAVMLAIVVSLHLRRLAALRAWLRHPKHFELPEPNGLWGEVFDGLLDLQRKNKKRKKKLAMMLAQYQASTAALPDGAVVLGEHGEIRWFNEAAQRLLGLRPSLDIGLRIANLVRHPAFTDYMARGDFEGEVEAPPTASRPQTLSLRIIPYGTGEQLLIVRDVSELRRLERARRDFVANASHELRTPLTVLRGYLDMMEPEAQGRSGPLAPWRTPLAEMKNQATRMEALVNDMLRLARMEADGAPMKEERLDVPALLRRAADEARALSGGEHRFELQVDPALGLSGGEAELLSIVGNLVSNAVRYTPAGGVIRIEWGAGPLGPRFAVADSGIGIAEKDIARLTERFYRVDVGRSRASGGTGLGLSIVKHALERFDAHLEIHSELGVGSTFACTFPQRRAQVLAASAEVPG